MHIKPKELEFSHITSKPHEIGYINMVIVLKLHYCFTVKF